MNPPVSSRWIAAVVSTVGALTLAATASASAAPPRSFFGVVPQAGLSAADYPLMAGAGVGTLRIPFAPRPTTTGGYDWTAIDATVAAATDHGIAVFPFFSNPPSSRSALERWSGYVAAAVERYGREGAFWAEHPGLPGAPIEVWQISDRDDARARFAPRPSPRRYARALASAAGSIRAQDPAAEIVLGGVHARSGDPRAAPRYLARLYRVAGARRDFDGVAVQPSGSRLSRAASQIDAIRRVMNNARDRRTPIWVTGIGYGSATGGSPRNRGPSGQAAALTRAYEHLIANRRRLRLRAVSWYSWSDSATPACAWCSTSGLVTGSRQTKPAWRAFTKLTGSPCRVPARDCPQTAPGDPPPERDRFFGVQPQSTVDDWDFVRMELGNLGTVRFILLWPAAQPSRRHAPDLTQYDSLVLAAAKRGIRAIPALFGTPNWAGETDDPGGCRPECIAFAPRSEKTLGAWSRFVSATVERYGHGGSLWAEHPEVNPLPVETWQVWNEQNSSTYYRPAPDPQAYANLLRASSNAIRERDPRAETILGGMAGLASVNGAIPAWDYLDGLYAIAGVRDDFDGVAAHPYAPRLSGLESQLTRIHDRIAAAGDDQAELWITEFGASSGDGDNPLEVGRDGQATLLADAVEFFLAKRSSWNIPAVVWYSWRDVAQPAPCAWCANSGLFGESGFDAKPAWRALMSFTGGT